MIVYIMKGLIGKASSHAVEHLKQIQNNWWCRFAAFLSNAVKLQCSSALFMTLFATWRSHLKIVLLLPSIRFFTLQTVYVFEISALFNNWLSYKHARQCWLRYIINIQRDHKVRNNIHNFDVMFCKKLSNKLICMYF